MQKHLSRMMAALALGLIGSLGLTATSHASLIEFEGSYDVTANSDDPGLEINTSLLNDGELAFSLDEGESYTIDLFQIWTEETIVNNDDTNPQDITVEFSFTLPVSFSGTSQGQTVGQSTTVFGFLNTQSGVVSWNNPASMNFDNDGLLNVSLSNETFNWGLYGLTGGPHFGEHFGATVQGTFTLAQAPSQLAQAPNQVPEPGALALLGLGLLGMGLASPAGSFAVRARRLGQTAGRIVAHHRHPGTQEPVLGSSLPRSPFASGLRGAAVIRGRRSNGATGAERGLIKHCGVIRHI